jgi:predicted nucleotidyltransferase
MEQYVKEVQKIYGNHLRQVILYGSYARGDYREDSDIDIMILLDISDIEIKDYFEQLVDMTFDFNMAYDTDIKPIAKNESHFKKWVLNYPFYANVSREGVTLYGAA